MNNDRVIYLILEEKHPLKADHSIFRVYHKMEESAKDRTLKTGFMPLYIGRETFAEAADYINGRVIERNEAPAIVEFAKRT